MSYEEQLLQHLPLVDRIVGRIARHSGLSEDDREEFAAVVRLKLVEGEYQVLRKFQGRATMATYLAGVISHLLLDFRIERWGKWRPSAAARRLGPLAIHLERLLTRDRHTFEEACGIIGSRSGVEVTRQELEALHEQLPVRSPHRRLVQAAEDRFATDGTEVEASLRDRDREIVRARAREALQRALVTLDPQDRLIIKLRFEDAFTVVRIAALLREDQRRLYRRLEELIRRLRRLLEADNIHAADVDEILGDGESPAIVRSNGGGEEES